MSCKLSTRHARAWNKRLGVSVLISEDIEWRTQAYQTRTMSKASASTLWPRWILRRRERNVAKLKSIRTQKGSQIMRRSVFIAGLAAALVLGMGVFGSGVKRFQASAQQ